MGVKRDLEQIRRAGKENSRNRGLEIVAIKCG
jgi:hypothetical protein